MHGYDTHTKRTFLRTLRQRHGLSQVALAARAGVSLNTVSLAERAGLLSARSAERLAMALGVAASDLLPCGPEPSSGTR